MTEANEDPDNAIMLSLANAETGTDLALAKEMAAAEEQARDYLLQAKSANTLRGYRADWNHFTAWCTQHDKQYLPAQAETVALYLTVISNTHKCSTLQRRLVAISQAHQAAGFETPTTEAPVRATWAGIRRVKGTRQEGKTPTLTADIRRMVDTLPETKTGQRDRALLLFGFAGAFRRSELVSLTRADLLVTSEGITVTLRRSKTDQEGEGRKVGIPYGSRPHTCPVRALLAWLEAAEIEAGPLFRGIHRNGTILPRALSDKSVALIVKKTAEAAGLESALYAGHSLRSGLATSAAQAGVSERAIMKQTGHASVNMVRRYIRDGSLFRENAAAEVGL